MINTYYWELQAHFQKIEPFQSDQWDKRNQGWYIKTIDTWFGGIVYLTKNPCPNSGTSLYSKQWIFPPTQDEITTKKTL
ncbi:MAG: hypothetical protein CM15mV22_1170 [Eurybiavirus sp.]|nr:MAG: hypothetical protein CM15mV22_1170 [Eurybiavirus sp.]